LSVYLLVSGTHGIRYRQNKKTGSLRGTPLRDGVVINMWATYFDLKVPAPQDILDMSMLDLVTLLRPTCSLPYQKAAKLKCLCEELIELHSGLFPTEIAEMTALTDVDYRIAEHIRHLVYGLNAFPMDEIVLTACKVFGWCDEDKGAREASMQIKSWSKKNSWKKHETLASVCQLLTDLGSRSKMIGAAEKIGCLSLIDSLLKFCHPVKRLQIMLSPPSARRPLGANNCWRNKDRSWIDKKVTRLRDLGKLRAYLKCKGIGSIRDRWTEALPNIPKDDARFPFSVYLLMQNTKGVNDRVSVGFWNRLFRVDNLLFSVHDINDMSMSDFVELMRPASMFYQNAGMAKCICELLIRDHGGKMPMDLATLKSMPGIGHKIGSIITYLGYGLVTGVAMDRHVHRFCLSFFWCNNRGPDGAVYEVEAWLPWKEWGGVNDLIAGTCQLLQDTDTQSEVINAAAILGKETLDMVTEMEVVSRDLH
jgi:endonuclease III